MYLLCCNTCNSDVSIFTWYNVCVCSSSKYSYEVWKGHGYKWLSVHLLVVLFLVITGILWQFTLPGISQKVVVWGYSREQKILGRLWPHSGLCWDYFWPSFLVQRLFFSDCTYYKWTITIRNKTNLQILWMVLSVRVPRREFFSKHDSQVIDETERRQVIIRHRADSAAASREIWSILISWGKKGIKARYNQA